MNHTERSDLHRVLDILQSGMRYILLCGLIAGALAFLGSLAGKKNYRAVSEVFLSSPFFSDRNNIYHTSNQTAAFVGYFASEEDIDKLIGISKTDEAARRIVVRTALPRQEKLDTTKPQELTRLMNIFKSNFGLERSEYGLLQISYKNEDPVVAAEVANVAVTELGQLFSGFHTGMRSSVAEVLQSNIHATDSAIAVLTDSLGVLRDRYGIYDILSPNRQTIINNAHLPSAASGYGHALEQIQNIESIKDQLVVDRARYQSILSEYNEDKHEPSMVQVMSQARPPVKPVGLGLMMSAVVGLILGCVLGAFWVLVRFYFSGRQTAKA